MKANGSSSAIPVSSASLTTDPRFCASSPSEVSPAGTARTSASQCGSGSSTSGPSGRRWRSQTARIPCARRDVSAHSESRWSAASAKCACETKSVPQRRLTVKLVGCGAPSTSSSGPCTTSATTAGSAWSRTLTSHPDGTLGDLVPLLAAVDALLRRAAGHQPDDEARRLRQPDRRGGVRELEEPRAVEEVAARHPELDVLAQEAALRAGDLGHVLHPDRAGRPRRSSRRGRRSRARRRAARRAGR